ncbi:Phosphatidylserine decarboxylase proenzyme 1 [Yarrowia sp. B02]|nr:Phosphatidylserine decarboxylase proenzyme 1 [Yarrowia sp. B02]
MPSFVRSAAHRGVAMARSSGFVAQTTPWSRPSSFLNSPLTQCQYHSQAQSERYQVAPLLTQLPRPRRKLLVNPVPSLKRGLCYINASKRRGKLLTGARKVGTGIRVTRRYASSGTRGSAKAIMSMSQRKYFTWWFVPAISIVLWGIYQSRRNSVKDEYDEEGNLVKRAPVRPSGPWHVAVYSTLPLKALSRWWGSFNDITLPVWMRDPGYRFYSFVFGANLDEVAEDDLRVYQNLGEFFYRELKEGARPIDPDADIVCPADGKVLHLGAINARGEVEQVKGVTYSLEALLGPPTPSTDGSKSHAVSLAAPTSEIDLPENQEDKDREFANVNGISYTLDDFMGGNNNADTTFKQEGDATAGQSSDNATVAQVGKELLQAKFNKFDDKELFFAVIYLAPGDYHRFHSPVNWVAEIRRHFVGELYSVAPYFQKKLGNLFVLNERVALLGKWKYGFFSMTPVGATNVGSIKIHFDKDLRTNTVYEPKSESEAAEQEKIKKKRMQKNTCYEATYGKASKLLGTIFVNS